MKPLIALFILTAVPVAQAAAPPLRQVAVIPLGDVKGRIDHMSIDAAGSRLFVAALGNNSVEVIDLLAGKVAQHLAGMQEPQGVRFVADTKMLAVASGGDGKCRLYDDALKLVSTLDNLDDADNVRDDGHHFYVGYGKGAVAVCDRKGIIASIKLAAHPESFQLESKGNRIFVNVPSARLIEVVDRDRKRVVAQWPVKQAQANFPMALDESRHRLIVVCRNPAKMLVLDTESGKVVATTDACGDADDVWLDEPAHRIYVTGGEGCISVIEQIDADHYQPAATIPTARGARTSFFDPQKRRLYLAVPKRDAQPAEIRVYAPAV